MENNQKGFAGFLKRHWLVILTGLAVGAAAVVLSTLGNPKNMGFCIACFERDIAGALKFHTAGVVQYFRPEIVGIVIGAMLMAMIKKEWRPQGGSSPITRFFIGMFVMIGGLVFLGCPLRMVIRIGGGDLNAVIGLLGFIVGIVIGVVAAVVIGIVVLAIIGYNVQKKEAETTAAPAAAATTKASDGFDAASPTTNPYTVPFDGSYTKGAFDGTEYVNPWANLRIPLPSGWKEDDAAEYADWESEEIVDCGFTCTAPDGDNLVVLFIHSETDATADDYRDAHDKSIKEGEIPLKNEPAHSRATIAGKEYLGSDYVFAKDGKEFAESMYVRLIDDTFVVMLIFGDTVDENDDLMKTIIKPY